ncbi:MAG: TetR/AcrR family transcriptional regulator [Chitinophagales bacterium]|nr:TetR/AcrR family transcriptional regulator [Chitinophagales bacterium]
MPKQKVDEQYIIIQSLILFRQRSFHSTSMSDIAKACGILKGSLYHYFKSKEELMEKVIRYVHQYFKVEVFAKAYEENIPANQRFKNMMKASEKIFFDASTGKMYGNMGVESALVIPEFNPIIREFFQDFFNAIKHIYADKYAEEIANELAERSVAEVEGSIMMSRVFNDKSYIKNTHKRLLSRIEKIY